MAEQSLGEYLDHLIGRAYVTTRFTGRLQVSQRATEASVRHYIEDEVTGRPVPLDDSADHFLLMTFHRLREEFLDRPFPVYEEPKPVSGEIPWRELSTLSKDRDPSLYYRDSYGWWRCVECAHTPDEHYPEPYSGDTDAGYECSKCNCGNNSRM